MTPTKPDGAANLIRYRLADFISHLPSIRAAMPRIPPPTAKVSP